MPGKKGVYSTEPPSEQADADPSGEVVLVESVEDILGDASEADEEEEDEEIPF